MGKNFSSKFIRALVAVIVLLAVTITVFTVKGYYKDGILATPTPTPIIVIEEKIVVPEEPEKTVDISLLNENIQSIGELAAFEYLYTDSAYSEDANYIKNFKLPLTTNSFVLKWDGTIKAGIDVKQLKAEADEKNKVITLYIPEAKILSHEIDKNSFEVLNEKTNIFNPIEVGDVNDIVKVSMESMEKRAVENGLLINADAEVKTLLKSFILSLPDIGDTYTVTFSAA